MGIVFWKGKKMSERALVYWEKLCEATSKVQRKMEDMCGESRKVTGTMFEGLVHEALLEIGIEEEQLTHSSQKFPDFVIKDASGLKVGVEVKKTDSKKWEMIGGSVYESLRQDLDETYILMGKFGGVPEARLRKYEECLQDMKVTHSPRFYLNLDLPKGEDYLTRNNAQDLLELSGENLDRKIRELLRTDRSTWYSEDTTIAYTDLSSEDKDNYLNDGIALFPEVFRGDYSNFTPWMIYKCMVWCPNVRDIFSAGGVALINGMYVSAIMNRTIVNIEKIVDRIRKMSAEEVVKYWNSDAKDSEERINTWIELVEMNLKLSKQLLGKNKSLECFSEMTSPEIGEIIKDEFINILKRITLAED